MKPQHRLQMFLLPVTLCVCFMAWLAGFNFDKRGFEAFGIAFISIAITALIAIFPSDS